MAPKNLELGLQLLQSLLGLRSPPLVESSGYRPPIFISIPSHSNEKKKELPLTLTILDLLDLAHLSPQKVITSHTFTNSVPLCWTKTTKNKVATIFVTKNIFSLEQLLPPKRDLVFVSTDYEPDLRDVKSMLGSLDLTPKTSIVGIFDIEMLAREIAGNCGRYSLPAILRRLQCPMEKLGNDTEVMLRAMLLLVVESWRKEFVETGDTTGKAWLDCIRAVGMGSSDSTMDAVRKGVKKVGNAIVGRVMRSAEEIQKIRAERKKRREEAEVEEEYVSQMRLWDGMWELL